eukprot:4146939-Pleurochrysis_carterae.AAC.1
MSHVPRCASKISLLAEVYPCIRACARLKGKLVDPITSFITYDGSKVQLYASKTMHHSPNKVLVSTSTGILACFLRRASSSVRNSLNFVKAINLAYLIAILAVCKKLGKF